MYNMEILLGDFNAKLEREDTFKLTRGMIFCMIIIMIMIMMLE